MRQWALVGIVLITCLVAMEGTVVSTAMPRTVAELGGSDHIALVFSAYLGALAIMGPVWGNLADRWGARPVYILCVVVFLIGSTWASMVHSMQELVLARFVQGLGGGGLTPLGQTVLSLIYERHERASAQAWLVSAFGLASLFGPPLGGWITQEFDWRWVFLLSLPFGGVGAVLLFFFLRPPALELRQVPFDWLGLGLFVVWMLAALQISPWMLPLGLLLWLYSRRLEHPFLPLPLLRFPVFGAVSGLAILLGAGLFGGGSFFPVFLQDFYKLNPVEAGRAMLPLMLGWVACSSQSARWALRFGYGRIVGLSALSLFGGYVALCLDSVVLGQIGLGMAGGLSFTPLTLSVQDAVPREQLGQATSSVVFLRTLGASLGTALMGAVLHSYGFAWMFRCGAALSLLGVLAFLPYRRAVSS
ncbi:hypothetical protein ABS71_11320 [bacterium SCN 62-11]|nr:MAG: hypothetical protein ABS71_11320 [bacterium SCN 62-11]